MSYSELLFDWNAGKNLVNQAKHGVSFEEAEEAFYDLCRVIEKDTLHSSEEETRYHCYGKVKGKVMTVRFTLRGNRIRIFGAAYWRKGKKIYEEA